MAITCVVFNPTLAPNEKDIVAWLRAKVRAQSGGTTISDPTLPENPLREWVALLMKQYPDLRVDPENPKSIEYNMYPNLVVFCVPGSIASECIRMAISLCYELGLALECEGELYGID